MILNGIRETMIARSSYFTFDSAEVDTNIRYMVIGPKKAFPGCEIKSGTVYKIELVKDDNGEIELLNGFLMRNHHGNYSLVSATPVKQNKLNSEGCKKELVKFCTNNESYIRNQFVPPLSDEDYKKTLKVKNWSRLSKLTNSCLCVKEHPGVERAFDCRPFEDQLRGYVHSDITDSVVKRVVVQGE